MNILLMVILGLMCEGLQERSARAISTKNILESFEKVLDFYIQNPHFTGLSGVFGIIRAEALLSNIFTKNEKVSPIYTIKQKSKDILKSAKNIPTSHSQWVINISDPSIWRTKISYKWLEGKCYHQTQSQTRNLLNKLRNEAETACITPEMFSFCVNHSFHSKSIYKIDPGCSYFFFGSYKGIGYETTHRLLFIQILKIWNLFSNSQVLLVQSLCRYILQQVSATQDNFLFFDLFLEQIFLCGVEGYKEFLNTNWLETILHNQLKEGCFPMFSKNTKFNNSSVLKEQCSDHATGLASAMLALHVHFRSQFYPINN